MEVINKMERDRLSNSWLNMWGKPPLKSLKCQYVMPAIARNAPQHWGECSPNLDPSRNLIASEFLSVPDQNFYPEHFPVSLTLVSSAASESNRKNWAVTRQTNRWKLQSLCKAQLIKKQKTEKKKSCKKYSLGRCSYCRLEDWIHNPRLMIIHTGTP